MVLPPSTFTGSQGQKERLSEEMVLSPAAGSGFLLTLFLHPASNHLRHLKQSPTASRH